MASERGYWVTRLLLWLAVVACLLFVVMKFWQAVVSGFESAAVREMAITLASPISLIIVVGTVLNINLLPAIHRFNCRLRAGRHGDYAALPLVPVQPDPDVVALALPTTITMGSRWSAKIPVFSLASIFMAFAIAVLCLTVVMPSAIASNDFRIGDIAVPIGFTSIILVLGVVAGFRPEQETLEITDLGITLRRSNSPDQSIHWDDVRLFAIGASARSKQNPASMAYILANPNTSVTWSRIHRLAWYTYLRPTTPFEEYNRQMEALLSLIAERTGLPLYDLR